MCRAASGRSASTSSRLCGRAATVEECGFGLTAPQQTRIDDSSRMIPQHKLGSSAREGSGVQVAKQSGSLEGTGTDVEHKVHQGIEFFLCEVDRDEVVDTGCRAANVLGEQGLRLGLGD